MKERRVLFLIAPIAFDSVFGFPGSPSGKESIRLSVQETWVQSLGQEDHPEEGMSTHSSILARKIPWTEEPLRLQPTRLQRVRHE